MGGEEGGRGVYTIKIYPKTKVSAKYEVKISNGVELPPPTYIKSRLVVAPFDVNIVCLLFRVVKILNCFP